LAAFAADRLLHIFLHNYRKVLPANIGHPTLAEARKRRNAGETACATTADGFPKKRDENDMKKTAFVENVILTIKLLVVLSLLGAALWGLELWIS
jgi:hypothetical protein